MAVVDQIYQVYIHISLFQHPFIQHTFFIHISPGVNTNVQSYAIWIKDKLAKYLIEGKTRECDDKERLAE